MTVRIVGSKRARMRKVEFTEDARKALRAGVEVFISSGAASKIEQDGLKSFREGKECMGLLYGIPFRQEGRRQVKIEAAVSLPVNSTPHHVSVDRTTDMPEGQDAPPGSIVVGWYHSHTGVGNFMSGTDRNTHGRWFSSPFAVSIVFEAAERSLDAYRMVDGEFVRVRYELYRD